MKANRTNVLALVGPHANYATQTAILRSVVDKNSGFTSSRASNILKNMKPSMLRHEFLEIVRRWKENDVDIDEASRGMRRLLDHGAVVPDTALRDIVEVLCGHYVVDAAQPFVSRFVKIMERSNRATPTVLRALLNVCVAYKEYYPATHGKLFRWCKRHGGVDFGPLLIDLISRMRQQHNEEFIDLEGLIGLLVELGADPNAVRRGATALHRCLDLLPDEDAETAVEALLTHGANPNILMSLKRKSQRVPMLYACIFDDAAPHLVQTLADHGADPNARDGRGTHLLAMIACNPEVTTSRRAAFQTLLGLGADPARRDDAGDTVLHTILRRCGNEGRDGELAAIVKLCIAARPDIVNIRGARGASLLAVAAKNPSSWVVSMLVEAGATLARTESTINQTTPKTPARRRR